MRFAFPFVRLGIGGLFVWSGAVKLLDPGSFESSLETYRLFPSFLIPLLVLAVPLIEVLLGLMLLLGVWVKEACRAVMALCVIFIFALLQGVLRGLEVDCGCFGKSAPSVWKTRLAIVRDGMIWVAARWILRVKEF